MALTCRYYGISRQIFYAWYRRYQADGLAALRGRSRTGPRMRPVAVRVGSDAGKVVTGRIG